MDELRILLEEPMFWSRLGMAEDPTRYGEDGRILFKEDDWSGYAAEHAAFLQVGVRVHTTVLHSGWVGVERYDYSGVDRTLEAICGISPELLYMPRIKLNAPIEWCLRYPQELYLAQAASRDAAGIRRALETQLPFFSTGGLAWDYDDQGRAVGLQSICSEKWREDASRALERLLAHLAQSPYAGRIIGYQIGFGMCAENAWWGGWVAPRRFGDFGLAAAERFEAYCVKRFGTAEKAAAAFGVSYTGDPVCLVPAVERRRRAPRDLSEYFRADNPQAELYARFLSEETAESICRFARVIKEKTRKPVGAFYGYLFSSYPAQIGHLAVQRLLDCEAVDFLSSPKGYYRSGPGQPGGAQSVSCSARRKKLWLDELDNGTHIAARVHKAEYYPNTLEETKTVLWREAAKNLAWGNQNFWWMDLGGNWFLDEKTMALFPDLLRFIRRARAMKRESHCEILFILDEESLYYQNEDPNMMGGHHTALADEMAAELLLCGAPVEQYRLRDLMEMDLSKYRMLVFANAFCVDRAMRECLRQRLAPGALCVWHYAAGVRNPAFAWDNVRDLTGMAVAPYAADYAVNNGYGVEVKLPPLQILPGEGVEALRRYPDGHIRVARKGNHLLSVSMDFRAADFAALARDAGCRMYAPPSCAVYADSRFTGFFPAFDQEANLWLGEAAPREELLHGGQYAASILRTTLKAKDALLFLRM